MWTAIGIILFVLGLLVSIGWHEAGHLFFAKRFGVRVSQYMLGFGPTLFSRHLGETEYGVKAVPLGGYIRIVGMVPPARSETVRDDAMAGRSSLLRQLIERTRQADRSRVEAGDDGRQFYQLSPTKRIIVMLAGPVQNLILATLLFGVIVTAIGLPTAVPVISEVSQCLVPATVTTTVCPAGAKPSPAALAGLRAGDRITSISRHQVTSWDQAVELIQDAAGKTVPLTYERAGVAATVQVPIVENAVATFDANGRLSGTERTGFLGVFTRTEFQRKSIGAAFGLAGQYIHRSASSLVALPGRIPPLWASVFGGAERQANGPVGIVGAGRISGDIFSLATGPRAKILLFLELLAGFNMGLFLLNLLPLLPLDGGHVLGAAIEWIRRGLARVTHRATPGPFDVARLMPLAYVVALLFFGLSALTFLADIINPVKLS